MSADDVSTLPDLVAGRLATAVVSYIRPGAATWSGCCPPGGRRETIGIAEAGPAASG